MLGIGIYSFGSLIMQESGLNVRSLLPGTLVDLIGKDWIEKERNGLERKEMGWKELIQKG